jgi:hypothetical protein
MAEGRIVYYGRGVKAGTYFDKLGFSLPKLQNPADSLIRIISQHYPPTEEDTEKIALLHETYE